MEQREGKSRGSELRKFRLYIRNGYAVPLCYDKKEVNRQNLFSKKVLEALKIKRRFDFSIFYALANLFVLFVLYALSFLIFNNLVESLSMKVIIGVSLVPLCLIIEYKFLIKFVNPITYFFLPESYKRERIDIEKKVRKLNNR